jgi:hypothetical protein
MKHALLTVALAAGCGLALAKLPAPDDAAKAKAAETAAKSAWQAKVDAYLLCKAQDKVAARFGAGKAAAKDAKPVMTAAKAAPAAEGTPVPAVAAPAPIPPCVDPGPFAYTPAAQKPLEASGAHSPAGTAASPPSVKQPSAEMKRAEKKKS